MHIRAKHLVLPVAAAGLLGSALVAPAASAAPEPAAATLAQSGVAAWNVAAFWYANNQANLLAATPYDVEPQAKHVSKGGFAPGEPGADGEPGVVEPIGGKPGGSSENKNVNLPKTTGKVFFLGADGKPHWCSATSLQSTYRNLVATAGHCVYDTKSNAATMKYWVFVPGYYDGKLPWGLYAGRQAFTHDKFDVYKEFDYDYAFVTVYNGLQAPPQGGAVPGEWTQVSKDEYDEYRSYDAYSSVADQFTKADPSGEYFVWKFADAGRLGDNVGGQGLAYNQQPGKPVFVVGYPSGWADTDGDYAATGDTEKWCYGATSAAWSLDLQAAKLLAVPCPFTGGGASGSAWLAGYSHLTRTGYLNGLTVAVSDTDDDHRIDTSLSPYFDGKLYDIYKQAADQESGSITG
ncbi:trypsin-like serine peptidase [Microtetraspora malaysiensis]|uniref:trypsin-like serine peptidase n=1 Tax=Microtetraspora malaysiensis TaxID=161358 RepID=UPI003D8D6C8D